MTDLRGPGEPVALHKPAQVLALLSGSHYSTGTNTYSPYGKVESEGRPKPTENRGEQQMPAYVEGQHPGYVLSSEPVTAISYGRDDENATAYHTFHFRRVIQ